MMAARTEAQEEFDNIISRASANPRLDHHEADTEDYRHDRENSDRDEDEEYVQRGIDENMRMPASNNGGTLHLPHRDFDMGRTTGVKGVICGCEELRGGTQQNWGLEAAVFEERECDSVGQADELGDVLEG